MLKPLLCDGDQVRFGLCHRRPLEPSPMSSKPTGESSAALLATFEIKSAQLPVVALFLKSNDAAQMALNLLADFGPGSESSDFFENEPVVFDFSMLDPMLDCPDLQALSEVAKACGLVPVAFRPQPWQCSAPAPLR